MDRTRFKLIGKTPEARGRLMILVLVGRRSGKHLYEHCFPRVKRINGIMRLGKNMRIILFFFQKCEIILLAEQ
jgi:hypothetical protein